MVGPVKESDLLSLPMEIKLHCLSLCSPITLLALRRVCTEFKSLTDDNNLWYSLIYRKYQEKYEGEHEKKDKILECLNTYDKASKNNKSKTKKIILFFYNPKTDVPNNNIPLNIYLSSENSKHYIHTLRAQINFVNVIETIDFLINVTPFLRLLEIGEGPTFLTQSFF